MTLPGMLIVCADSHTCTHGGMGALAFGVGASEATHVLATQTIRQQRPRTMRIRIEGRRPGRHVGQGHGVAGHRSAGCRCRARVRRRMGRRRGGCPLGRGATDAVQHVDRDGCQDRHGRARRHDVRVPRRATDGADRRVVRSRRGVVALAAERRRRHVRRRARARRSGSGAADHLGHEPRAGGRGHGSRARPCRRARSGETAGDGGRARLHGPATRPTDAGSGRSTGCSSARVPTVACRTFARLPRWSLVAMLPRACTPGWFRAPSTSCAPPRPRVSTVCFVPPASNGASRVARCASRQTVTSSVRASVRCRPATATSSAARVRERARTWPVRPSLPQPR